MKKLSFFLAVMFLAVITVFGQRTFKPAIGVSSNSFSGAKDLDSKAQVGALIGGSIAFGKKFYIEPGVFYATKSSEITYRSVATNSTFSEEALIKGVRVPVSVGLGVLGNDESFISLRAFGGGSAFFVTGVGKDVPDKDYITSPAWGLYAGAGADFWIMFAELSYEWSVTDATTDEANYDVGKSQTLFFTLGLRF